MPTSQKIITKLRDRRQIEARLREMLAARTESEFEHLAQEIADLGSEVIPTIVSNLDQADNRQLFVMGMVAARLDRDEMITALRQAILQARLTDQGRIGAMTILERFLGQPPDNELLSRLSDPEGVALSSLEEILFQAAVNPTVLIDYVQGLDRQEPDVVLAVLRALQRMAGPSTSLEQSPGQERMAIQPLRMMAQDVREEIAAATLQALGAFRHPEAAWALQTLVPISAPLLQPLARRAVRKSRFAGVPMEDLPAPDPAWRALVSPVDGHGQQNVRFILEDARPEDAHPPDALPESQGSAQARFLDIRLSDQVGAFDAAGHSHMSLQKLPPRRPLGHLHDIAHQDASGAMLMLEATFDLGRRLVLDALVHNRETQIPVAGALRLLSPWLWGYAGADSLPAPLLPELSAADRALVATSGRLLEHPAFAAWTVHSEAVVQAAEEALRHPGWDLEVWVKRLVDDWLLDPAVAQMINRRLVAMSEWLLLAGDEMRAKMALVTALAIQEGDPREVAFVQALVRRELRLIVDSPG